MWEKQWRKTGMPEIGDYIQCVLVHEVTFDSIIEQGMIAHIRGDFVYFVGEDPNEAITDEYKATRWRKWIGPEIEQMYQKKVRINAN